MKPPLVCASFAHPNVSVSPVMYNAAFRALGLDYVYVSFDVTDLRTAIAAIRALNLRGVSVSRPWKCDAAALVDELDPAARAIGALNIIRNEDGRLVGYNSDWLGAVEAISRHIDIRGARAAVVGAGGAARAVAWGLKQRGAAEVRLFNRTASHAEAVAAELGVEAAGLDALAKARDADIIVNATCVTDALVPPEILREGQAVLEAVVLPAETRLVRDARKAGCRVATGAEMLVLQGAVTFELFTGARASLEIMSDALRSVLAIPSQ